MEMNFLSTIDNIPIERQYEALNMFIHRNMIEQQAVTHADIIAIGEKLLKMMESSRRDSKDSAEYLDYYNDELNKSKHELQQEFIKQTKELKQEYQIKLKLALEEQKENYENTIDRIVEVHSQSEFTKLSTQKRQFQEELQKQLQAKAEEVAKQKDKEFELERQRQYEIFSQKFQNELEEAVQNTKDKQQEIFIQEKRKLIDELEAEHEFQMNNKLTELKNKLRKAEELMKERYSVILEEYKKAVNHHKIIENHYQELQYEFKRFLDSTDGYLNSDYLLKLRVHSLDKCDRKLELFQENLQLDCYSRQFIQFDFSQLIE